MTLYYIRRCPFTKAVTGSVRLEATEEIAASSHGQLTYYGWQTCSCWRYWLYRLTGV